jgi:hypothetical protein
MPVRVLNSVLDPRCEFLQLAQNRSQFTLQQGFVLELPFTGLQSGQALFLGLDPWFELPLVQQTLRVAVDQAGDPSLQLGCLSLDLTEGVLLRLLDAFEPAAIFALKAFGVLQDVLDGLPDHLVQLVRPNLLVLADSLTAEPEGIGADASVICVVSTFAFAGGDADRLAVEGVAASLAFHQPLQKVGGTAFSLSGLFPILLQLFLSGLEQLWAHNGWNGHRQPFFTWDVISRMGPTRLFGLPSSRGQPIAHRPQAGLSEGGHAHVGRVP